MTTLAHILATVIFASAVAVILYWFIRRHQRQLGKECAVIFAFFGSAFITVAAIKTNSPPARAIRQVVVATCTNIFHSIEQKTGYAVSEARTDETHDLTIPDNAQIAERIARRGAHRDGFWLFDFWTNRLAHAGLDVEHPVWVQTDGTVTVRSPAPEIPIEELSLYTTYSNITVYAPLQGSYGFLPASRWPEFNVSRIWTAVTDRGTRVITWEGALRNRDQAQPVSFQAEFHENGNITYRYDPPQPNFNGIGLFRNGATLTLGLSDFQDLLALQGTSLPNNSSTLQHFNHSTVLHRRPQGRFGRHRQRQPLRLGGGQALPHRPARGGHGRRRPHGRPRDPERNRPAESRFQRRRDSRRHDAGRTRGKSPVCHQCSLGKPSVVLYIP